MLRQSKKVGKLCSVLFITRHLFDCAWRIGVALGANSDVSKTRGSSIVLVRVPLGLVHTGSGTRFRLENGAARCSHEKRQLTILSLLTYNCD